MLLYKTKIELPISITITSSLRFLYIFGGSSLLCGSSSSISWKEPLLLNDAADDNFSFHVSPSKIIPSKNCRLEKGRRRQWKKRTSGKSLSLLVFLCLFPFKNFLFSVTMVRMHVVWRLERSRVHLWHSGCKELKLIAEIIKKMKVCYVQFLQETSN